MSGDGCKKQKVRVADASCRRCGKQSSAKRETLQQIAKSLGTSRKSERLKSFKY